MFLVETGESRTPRPEGPMTGYTTGLSGALFLAFRGFPRLNLRYASRFLFGCSLSASKHPHPGLLAPASPSPGLTVSGRSRCYAARANSRSPVNGCHRIYEGDVILGLQSATRRSCRTRASPFTHQLSHTPWVVVNAPKSQLTPLAKDKIDVRKPSRNWSQHRKRCPHRKLPIP